MTIDVSKAKSLLSFQQISWGKHRAIPEEQLLKMQFAYCCTKTTILVAINVNISHTTLFRGVMHNGTYRVMRIL